MAETRTPNRFCLGCGYSLRGLIDPQCPECGKAFDPNDPKTWSPRPLGEQRVHVAVDAAGSVFYWGCALPMFAALIGFMVFIAWVVVQGVFGK